MKLRYVLELDDQGLTDLMLQLNDVSHLKLCDIRDGCGRIVEYGIDRDGRVKHLFLQVIHLRHYLPVLRAGKPGARIELLGHRLDRHMGNADADYARILSDSHIDRDNRRRFVQIDNLRKLTACFQTLQIRFELDYLCPGFVEIMEHLPDDPFQNGKLDGGERLFGVHFGAGSS